MATAFLIAGRATPCLTPVLMPPFICRHHLLPRLADMEDPLRDAVLVDLLHQLPTILGEDGTMAAHLGSLAFVPTADGRLQMPKELYDPR